MNIRLSTCGGRVAIVLLCTVLNMGSVSANSEFDSIYNKTEFADLDYTLIRDIVRDVKWSSGNSFLYSLVRDGRWHVYGVDIQTGVVEEVDADSINRVGAGQMGGEREYMRDRHRGDISPDGMWEAYVMDYNVWIRPTNRVQSRETHYQLSFDGTENDSYGELHWAPNSKRLFAIRRERVTTREIMLSNSRPANQLQPSRWWIEYAKPGDRLSQGRPAMFDIELKQQLSVDATPFSNQYSLYFSGWSPNSRYAMFTYNQRGHQRYQIVAIDSNTGRTHNILDEQSNTFVYYNDIYTRYIDGGERLLFTSERSNWRHLYVADVATGLLRRLTKGDWNVREVLNIDEADGTILCYASGINSICERGVVAPSGVSAAGNSGEAEGEDPYNKHLVRVEMKSGNVVDLTPNRGNHTIYLSPDRRHFVDIYSSPHIPPVTLLRRASDGKVLMTLASADISALLGRGYTPPQVFVAKGRDGKTDIWGTIHRPSNFNPERRYPVVEYIYAGPHDSFVDKSFVERNRFDRLKEMGFIVVCIDGMGTDNRSKDFQDVCWRNLKDAGFDDRILWMKAAATIYPEMDITNVGIYGYSAGGQSAMGALLFHPEFYKVAVSLCGCHDNRMDKIWWNEQWMGYPVGPWYSESSNVDNAYRLQGSLLLINGEMDDNVDPASTLQVVAELVKHEKEFEQLYLPGHNHNLGSEYITKRIYEFFYRKLRGSLK